VANHKSALKRARQNEKRRLRNKSGRATNRTAVRKFVGEIEQGTAQAGLATIMSVLAGSAAKGFIPKKRAARKIGRLARAMHKATLQA
jgi:small subunit ribosomal protein S20